MELCLFFPNSCSSDGLTVSLIRGQILTTGPLAILAICYAIAAPSSNDTRSALLPSTILGSTPRGLSRECRRVAESLGERLPPEWNSIIREPFVITGDCSLEELGRYYQETIAPTSRALAVQFFDIPPTSPIAVVLCSTEDRFRECHRALGERDRHGYAGIYSRSERRIIVNIETGEGTLAHELTHALAHADHAELPEWLDEGLASLYEECEFSADGLRLIGLENWRGAALRQSLGQGQLQSVSDLASTEFAKQDPSLDYAHARYFCLFLQHRNLLEAFYRKSRTRHKSDPDGLASLCELMETDDPRVIDRQFQKWLNR